MLVFLLLVGGGGLGVLVLIGGLDPFVLGLLAGIVLFEAAVLVYYTMWRWRSSQTES